MNYSQIISTNLRYALLYSQDNTIFSDIMLGLNNFTLPYKKNMVDNFSMIISSKLIIIDHFVHHID